ncbi:uncharacterized protein LACBIDRAFT_336155, partial [Laccaria bicolor S238N-H82]
SDDPRPVCGNPLRTSNPTLTDNLSENPRPIFQDGILSFDDLRYSAPTHGVVIAAFPRPPSLHTIWTPLPSSSMSGLHVLQAARNVGMSGTIIAADTISHVDEK